MENASVYGCMSVICLAPIIMFALGIAIGSGRIPYRIRIEKKKEPDYNIQLED